MEDYTKLKEYVLKQMPSMVEEEKIANKAINESSTKEDILRASLKGVREDIREANLVYARDNTNILPGTVKQAKAESVTDKPNTFLNKVKQIISR